MSKNYNPGDANKTTFLHSRAEKRGMILRRPVPIIGGKIEQNELSAEDRKARRADNKLMAKSRKLHRRRKAHGRH